MTSVARKCSFELCENPLIAKGFCAAHYRRSKLGLPLELMKRSKNAGMSCSQINCVRGASTAGMCSAHYARKRKGMNMEAPIRNPKNLKTCSHPGCERPYGYLDFCHLHAKRNAKGSDMDAPVQSPGRYAGCLVSWCEREHEANGYCGTHGYTVRRFNLNEGQITRLYSEGSQCDICGGLQKSGKALAVDHDHSCCPGKRSCGECVRGFLCSGCNTSLGLMDDKIERLEAAIKYLKKFQSKVC